MIVHLARIRRCYINEDLDTVDSDACALILISEWTSANGY